MSGYLKDSSRKQPVLSRGTVVSPVSRFGQSGDKTPGDGTPTRGGDKTGRGLSPYPLRFVDIRRCEARGPAPGRSPHGEGRARWGGMSSARTDGPNGARQARPAGCWAGQTLLGEPAEAVLPAVGAAILRAMGFVPGAVPPRCLEVRGQECKADAGASSGGAQQSPNPLALRSLQRAVARFLAAARRRALLRKRHGPWHRGNVGASLEGCVLPHFFDQEDAPHLGRQVFFEVP